MARSDKKNNDRRKGYDILPKIFCVIAAFILWLYVTQVETKDYEETFNSVSIELVNTAVLETESGLHVYSGHGNTVDVTVSGRKSDINKYKAENIRVFADVSVIAESGKHAIPINVEVPSGLTVSDTSLSSVTVYVDATSTIEVDVIPKISSAVIGDGCELGELSPEYTLVTVTGPNNVLANVDHAQISLDLGTVNSSVSTIGQLELLSKNGEDIDMRYVQLNRSEVKVTVPVFITKEVPLTVDYKHGYFNENNVKITLEPESVKIKGDPKALQDISSILLGTLDETVMTTDVKQVYPLSLPEGVISTEGVESVNVSVSHVGTTIRAFPITNIIVMGSEKLKYEILTETLTVRLRGPKVTLEEINVEDIVVSVNLAEYAESISGTVTLNAKVSVSGVTSGSVYPVGENPVQIKIN